MNPEILKELEELEKTAALNKKKFKTVKLSLYQINLLVNLMSLDYANIKEYQKIITKLNK